jgi:ATPase subunit of ABC transporter with duplicated ATPase domains
MVVIIRCYTGNYSSSRPKKDREKEEEEQEEEKKRRKLPSLSQFFARECCDDGFNLMTGENNLDNIV